MCNRAGGRRWLGAALALWIGMGATGAAGAASTVYDLYLGGLWLGELTVTSEREGPRYRAEAALGTSGLIAAFYRVTLGVTAEGHVGPRAWRPTRFTAETSGPRRSQAVAMRFRGQRPVSVEAHPPFRPRPWELDPAEQRGTTDPLSAFLAAAASRPGTAPCPQHADVFDGRRRHGVSLARAVEEQGLLRCEGLYRRLAGFKPKMMKRPDYPFTVWFAPRPDGGHAFLKAMGETPFGTAVFRRR